ncbi:class I mannose-6-phosphate isomerase [Anaerococcus lactolyticus]|uniref:class I mannose-6-phosphate isomerase n=1 Tax=Anaerococcus lactolyticus TaxID=33032 RepID=UPI00288A1FB7|nr:class I mannose-6-phosphate isomerase [Anaerococcus lactolyticus]
MNNVYKILPIYKSFVWGGEKLKKFFNLNTDQKMIGTIYHVISVPGELDNIVEETKQPLSIFYKKNRELFGIKHENFPVRMTTTVNEGIQSYQVHPDDKYALEHEGQFGKVSGIVSVEESDEVKEILFGNKAKTKAELRELIKNKDWDNLFKKIEVKEGDFLHTPSGVIHGGYGDGKIKCSFGSNGDVTYRFYDFERNDPERPLKIDEVIDCVIVPDDEYKPIRVRPIHESGLEIYNYYSRKGEYIAKRLKCKTEGSFNFDKFMFLTSISGDGFINGCKVSLGETIFIPCNMNSIKIKGNLDLIMISFEE